MRRAIVALVLTALAVLSIGTPAAAATVTHFTFHGTFADANWYSGSAAGFTDTFIRASVSTDGPELVVDQTSGRTGKEGAFKGGTETIVDVTSGYSFVMDTARLTSATVSASAVPATTCTLDAEFNRTRCSAMSIDLSASWTGEGPISRNVADNRFRQGAYSIINHLNGTGREATATGLIGGLALTASELQFAKLGTAKSGSTEICVGC